MTKQYEISDEDVDAMVRHLKFTDPKNATREHARAKLEELQAGLHGMAHTNPEKLDKLQAKIDAAKKRDSEAQ
jgi:hypothetical protein